MIDEVEIKLAPEDNDDWLLRHSKMFHIFPMSKRNAVRRNFGKIMMQQLEFLDDESLLETMLDTNTKRPKYLRQNCYRIRLS